MAFITDQEELKSDLTHRLAKPPMARYAGGMAFPELAAALKAIAQFPGWSEPEPETGYCWFNAPLMVAGVIEQGFVLHGGYLKHVPDANVSFELRALKPGARRTIPIARLDWRAVRGGHTNPRRPGSPVSGLRVSDMPRSRVPAPYG